MKVLGSIQTVRSIYCLNGEKLELDDTDYGFNRTYEIEIEIETTDKSAQPLLEDPL